MSCGADVSGSDDGSVPQELQWGFLMRSVAVTAFPDIRINAHAAAKPLNALHAQRLADGVLICLYGNSPANNASSATITITQPHHQQGFACGQNLTEDAVMIVYWLLPNKPNAKGGGPKISEPVEQKRGTPLPAPIVDWASRTLITINFAQQCIVAMCGADFFEWDMASMGIPSYVVAAQLCWPLLQLTIPVPRRRRFEEG
jgi:hypothetical protein